MTAILSALFFMLAIQRPIRLDPVTITASIATIDKSQRLIWLNKPGRPIYVIFENHTNKTLNLINEDSSWGYENLSFEAVDPNGAQYSIKRAGREWSKNMMSPMPILPDECIAREINLANGTWVGLPKVAGGKTLTTKIRAILDIKSDMKKSNVWTGHVNSKWTTITFANPK